MYRAGRLRRVFRARGKLVGTSDFVVTKGYVQIRVRWLNSVPRRRGERAAVALGPLPL